MCDIGVAHLVRAQNGLEPLKRFLASYAANPGRLEHELVVIFKGFDALGADIAAYQRLLRGVPYRPFCISDAGYDINAYLAVVRALRYRYFCFLNSYSVLLDEDWLIKLCDTLRGSGGGHPLHTGLVGVTGSYGSISSFQTRQRREWQKTRPAGRGIDRLRGWRDLSFQLREDVLGRVRFPAFPNHHVRTNAFMITGAVMRGLAGTRVKTKTDALMFESGRRSLTRRVLAMGLGARLVGRDGKAYDVEDWARSRTFWQGNQENLLVADNQTEAYRVATVERRKLLSWYAWGEEADPGEVARAGTAASAETSAAAATSATEGS